MMKKYLGVPQGHSSGPLILFYQFHQFVLRLKETDPAQSIYSVFFLFNQFWFIEFNYLGMINSSLRKVAHGYSCNEELSVFSSSFLQDCVLMSSSITVVLIELVC